MGNIHRPQRNGLCPAPLGKVRFHTNFRWFRNPFPLCRGGPVCPPVSGSREGAYPGRHSGRPRRRDGRQQANPGERADTQVRPYTVIGVRSNPRRGGAEPAPYASTGSAGVPICGPMQASAPTKGQGIQRRFAPRNNSSPPPGAQRSARPRPAAAAALPPAMPLRGKPDGRHFQKKQAADRGPPSFVPRRAAKRPRPSSVPPPQRPFRRQCRSAASRTAGTLNRSRHPTGGPRPPSPARSEAPAPVPGKVQEGAESPFLRFRLRRKESGSFFVAACT